MIKRALNRSRDLLFAMPGYERRLIDELKGKVSCLLYHRIEAYGNHEFLDRGGSPVISVTDFDRELGYLSGLPVQFYTLEELKSGRFPDRHTIGIVICFDDCFKCNYLQGLDILKKYSIHAVFFQCTGLINSSYLNWEHLLYWLYFMPAAKSVLLERLHDMPDITDINPPTIDNLREKVDSKLIEKKARAVAGELKLDPEIEQLARQLYPDERMLVNARNQGHEIASHGHHHYYRSTISEALFIDDLKRSYSILSELLGREPLSYSFPFNSYTSKDLALAGRLYAVIANVGYGRLEQPITNDAGLIPRLTWPGPSSNQYRMKRWLLTGKY